MTEQIEVFGQFDVRKDYVNFDAKKGLNDQMTLDKARITNTFEGDQLNAALDAIKSKKMYVRSFENQARKFYISRKRLSSTKLLRIWQGQIKELKQYKCLMHYFGVLGCLQRDAKASKRMAR